MKTLLLATLFVILALTLTTSAQSDPSEKVKATKTITGRFVGFVVGDFIHAEIVKPNGRKTSFFLPSDEMTYFLAENFGKSMTLTYVVVETDMPYDVGRQTIERLESVKVGAIRFEDWERRLRKRYSQAEIDKKYKTLVEKRTRY